MLKYRHLFFDLDNTLYDFEANSYLALEQVFTELKLIEKLPSFAEYFKVYDKVNHDLWALYREKKMAKDVLRGKRHKDSLAAFSIIPEISPLEIDDKYLKTMTTQTELFPGTIDMLVHLKNKGYQMHIITNGFKEVQHDKMVNTGLSNFFNNVFISEEIKSPKPSREIFEHAIKSSNARKKESIMIGDSWESDIVGAKNFGIDQVYFNLFDEKIDVEKYGEATYTISKLNELYDIF